MGPMGGGAVQLSLHEVHGKGGTGAAISDFCSPLDTWIFPIFNSSSTTSGRLGERNFYPRCRFMQCRSIYCFVVVLLVVLLGEETLIKILLYSPILFNFTMPA
jgi:hypothetical protein